MKDVLGKAAIMTSYLVFWNFLSRKGLCNFCHIYLNNELRTFFCPSNADLEGTYAHESVKWSRPSLGCQEWRSVGPSRSKAVLSRHTCLYQAHKRCSDTTMANKGGMRIYYFAAGKKR